MKNKIVMSVVSIVVLIGVFYGGMQYEKSSATAQATAMRGNFARGMGGAGGRGANGGFTGGQIISKDATSLTVSLQAGGSKIIFITDTTPVQKSESGSIKDLNIGENISVTGTANADGSVTAQNIQIRPATTTRQ